MNISVFISYSWDSEEHVHWTTRLAHMLYGNGIEACLDQIVVQPGSSLEKYMNEGVNDSRWVVCIISDGYVSKMDDLTTGVGKEIHLMKEKLELENVIPIVKNNISKTMPSFFKKIEKFYLDFDKNKEEDEFPKLIRRIYGNDKKLRPLVRENPFSKNSANERFCEAEIKKMTYFNHRLNGEIFFNYSNNDGCYRLGTGEYEFCTL